MREAKMYSTVTAVAVRLGVHRHTAKQMMINKCVVVNKWWKPVGYIFIEDLHSEILSDFKSTLKNLYESIS